MRSMRRRARDTWSSARSSEVNSVKSCIGSTAGAPRKCSTTASCAIARRPTQSRFCNPAASAVSSYCAAGTDDTMAHVRSPAGSTRTALPPGTAPGADRTTGALALRTRQ